MFHTFAVRDDDAFSSLHFHCNASGILATKRGGRGREKGGKKLELELKVGPGLLEKRNIKAMETT